MIDRGLQSQIEKLSKVDQAYFYRLVDDYNRSLNQKNRIFNTKHHEACLKLATTIQELKSGCYKEIAPRKKSWKDKFLKLFEAR